MTYVFTDMTFTTFSIFMGWSFFILEGCNFLAVIISIPTDSLTHSLLLLKNSEIETLGGFVR